MIGCWHIFKIISIFPNNEKWKRKQIHEEIHQIDVYAREAFFERDEKSNKINSRLIFFQIFFFIVFDFLLKLPFQSKLPKYSSLSIKRPIELTTEVRFFNCYLWVNLYFLQRWFKQHFYDLELDSFSIIIFWMNMLTVWQFHSKIRHVFNIIAILMHSLLVVNGFNSECLHFLNFQKRK